MTAVLLLLLASAEIDQIDPGHGGLSRPGEWSYADVRIRALETPFEGTVEIRSGEAFTVRIPVTLSPHGETKRRIPFVAGKELPEVRLMSAETVVASKRFGNWQTLPATDRLVGVASGVAGEGALPAFDAAPDGARIWFFEGVPAEEGPSWFDEPVDFFVGNGRASGAAWRMMGGRRLSAESGWRERVGNAPVSRLVRTPLTDERPWKSEPEASGRERQERFVILFGVLYVFAAFVLLFLVGRRGGVRLLGGAVVGLVLVAALSGLLLFPEGRCSVVLTGIDFGEEEEGASLDFAFLSLLRDGEVVLSFDRPVRPVFPDSSRRRDGRVVVEMDPDLLSSRLIWEGRKGDRLCLASWCDSPGSAVSLDEGVKVGHAVVSLHEIVPGGYREVGAVHAGEAAFFEGEHLPGLPRVPFEGYWRGLAGSGRVILGIWGGASVSGLRVEGADLLQRIESPRILVVLDPKPI